MSLTDVLAERSLPPLPEPLASPCIDSHTHLDTVEEFTGLAPETSLHLAAEVGITRLVQIGCDVAGSRFAEQFARSHDGVVAAVAIHPNDAADLAARSRSELDEALATIDELAGAGPHVRAIGETGIDHWGTEEPGWQVQREVFAAHVRMAHKHHCTLAIHDREGHDDVLHILDQEGWPERVIMHCFSGDAELAGECVRHGAWLSFPGVLTFNNAERTRQALHATPVDKILVETDAPFLTPHPRRGKRNGPYLIAHTIRFLSEQLDWDEASCCEQLRRNALAAYGGPWEDVHGVTPLQLPASGEETR